MSSPSAGSGTSNLRLCKLANVLNSFSNGAAAKLEHLLSSALVGGARVYRASGGFLRPHAVPEEVKALRQVPQF